MRSTARASKEHGAVLIFVLVALFGVLPCVAFAVDVLRLATAWRQQTLNAAAAADRAAAAWAEACRNDAHCLSGGGAGDTQARAQSTAVAAFNYYLGQNPKAQPVSLETREGGELILGVWDQTSRTFLAHVNVVNQVTTFRAFRVVLNTSGGKREIGLLFPALWRYTNIHLSSEATVTYDPSLPARGMSPISRVE